MIYKKLYSTLNQSILSALNIHWKYWCWSWSSNTLATWCEELTHWKSPWSWEILKAGGEGDNRGWDSWMASLTQWIEFEQAPGVSDGQGSLACCSPWGCKQSDMTEWLDWTELSPVKSFNFISDAKLFSSAGQTFSSSVFSLELGEGTAGKKNFFCLLWVITIYFLLLFW